MLLTVLLTALKKSLKMLVSIKDFLFFISNFFQTCTPKTVILLHFPSIFFPLNFPLLFFHLFHTSSLLDLEIYGFVFWCSAFCLSMLAASQLVSSLPGLQLCFLRLRATKLKKMTHTPFDTPLQGVCFLGEAFANSEQPYT